MFEIRHWLCVAALAYLLGGGKVTGGMMDTRFSSTKGIGMGGGRTEHEHEHAGQIPPEPLYSSQENSDGLRMAM